MEHKENKLNKFPTLNQFYGIFIVLLVFMYCAKMSLNCEDFWNCLDSGKTILEKGMIPNSINFAYPIYGNPYTDHRWLGHVILYKVFEVWGTSGILLLNAIIISYCYWLLYLTCLLISNEPRLSALATFFALFLGIENFGIRSQMFSTLSFMLLLGLLIRLKYKIIENPEEDINYFFTLISTLSVYIISIFWVNTHGAFPLSTFLILIFLIDALIFCKNTKNNHYKRYRETLFLLLIVNLIGLQLNPYNLNVLREIANTSQFGMARNISEWLPTNILSITGKALFASILLLLLVVKKCKTNFSFIDTTLVLIFMTFAFYSQRTGLWWGFIYALILARYGAPLLSKHFINSGNFDLTLSRVFLFIVFILALFSTPYTKHLNPILSSLPKNNLSTSTPTKLVSYLKSTMINNERFFNPVHWGGYIYWETRIPVFMDERIGYYPDNIWNDYLSISSGKFNFEKILDKWSINYVIADNKDQAGLIQALKENSHWKEIYTDEVGTVFKRTT